MHKGVLQQLNNIDQHRIDIFMHHERPARKLSQLLSDCCYLTWLPQTRWPPLLVCVNILSLSGLGAPLLQRRCNACSKSKMPDSTAINHSIPHTEAPPHSLSLSSMTSLLFAGLRASISTSSSLPSSSLSEIMALLAVFPGGSGFFLRTS